MQRQAKPTVIFGGKVICPESGLNAERDLLLEDGVVKAVEAPGAFSGVADAVQHDVSGKLVLPGLIDIHVHLREPGYEWKETVATGAAAAAAGGFSRICCMPNTNPINDTASVTDYIIEAAAAAGKARVHPIGAISVGSKGKDLAPMLELKEAGCVAFSDDGSPVMNAGLMRLALEYCLMVDAVLTVHEEDTNLSHGFSMNESVHSVRLGLQGMPGAAEDVMIARDIELARLTGGRVHFCHVSTARAVELIRRAKHDGISVTAEVAPHHCVLTEEAVGEFNTQAKMSMPLRSEEDRRAVLAGLQEGVIDCIASDHAPHESDSKDCEFERASFGIIGLQTTLPLMLEKVRSGSLKLERMVAALTCDAARCLQIDGGSLAVGSPADVAVVDPEGKWTLSRDSILSKSVNTPFLGTEFCGKAVNTFVGGCLVHGGDLEMNE
ncbi:MAG: dihydroorotase [Bdellovibrionales bacterium]|nr:dihydroorotase [Bdellovibrionales bacterium]